VLADNIGQAMWDKMVFLATLAGATCLMRSSVGTIMADVRIR
jgi:2-dehydropantoate 2-reductase